MRGTIQRGRNRGHTRGMAFAIMVVVFLFLGCAAARPAGREIYQGKEVAAGEVLVKFRDAAPEAIGLAKLSEDVDEAEYVGRARVVRLHSRSRNVERLIRDLSARPDVEYVEPNYIVHTVRMPDEPLFTDLWGLDNTGQTGGKPDADIDAPEAWDRTTGSPEVVVGVIDTGVDYFHPDLVENIWTNLGETPDNGIDDDNNGYIDDIHGINAITGTGDPKDDHSHGTHVSGTIGAVGNNGVGVAGVNWRTQVIGLKFLDSGGSGYTDDAVEAIDYAVALKKRGVNVRVLSNSWGGGGYSQTLYDAIVRANNEDILFVAAAGNNNLNNDWFAFYPANYNVPNIISVAATDHNDLKASFSNYGKTTVDLGAPGVSIKSTVPGGSYSWYSGTSMATPHVSGAAALILSACPTLTTADLKAKILGYVDGVSSLVGKTVTGGRLNVYNAIHACAPSGTPTTTTLSAPSGSSTYGVSVTFTATVTPESGSGVPTGTVTFYDGSSLLGSRSLDSSGQATFETSTLSGGQHSIKVTYGGDGTFAGSTSDALPYTVSKAVTTTGLSSDKTTSTYGEAVTFTATVSPTSATGTVTFSDGTYPIGTASISSGTASLSISTLAVGDHSVTAAYNGNVNYETSTSNAVPLTVSKGASTTTLTSSPNPSTVGQTVTFTATLSPATATGTVTFFEGETPVGEVTLSGGKASLSKSYTTQGSYRLKAQYSGDDNVGGSTSPEITQTVNPAPAGDFSISVSPSSWTVLQGGSALYTVTITPLQGFTGDVGLSVTGVPTGSPYVFIPPSIAYPGPSSVLTITTGSTTPVGKYTLIISGTSGTLRHTKSVTLRVRRNYWLFGKAAGEENTATDES